jgi:ABC-type sugar transport system ATPase subunit
MTVYENIAFGLQVKGVGAKEILGAIAQIAETLDIQHCLGKYPKHISDIQKQKTALARAVIKNPKVLILDAPLSSIETKARYEMRRFLKQFQSQQGFTLIYSCDNPIEAMALGDKICLMKDGEAVQISSPMDAYHNPQNKFAAQFLCDPFISFLEVQVTKNEVGIYLSGDKIEILLPNDFAQRASSFIGEKVLLSINAEDFSLSANANIASIEALVEYIEHQGSVKYVYANIGDAKNKIKVRLDSSVEIEIGQAFEFYIDIAKAHIFGQTGERIF